MQIKILSRDNAARFWACKPQEFADSTVISINCSCDPPRFPPSDNVLTIHFDDIEQDHGPNHLLFNKDHARQIIKFLYKAPIFKPLMIHCFAGVSRSGAVGDFARELFQLDYSEFKQMNPQIVPNVHIGKVLREVWLDEFDGLHHVDYNCKELPDWFDPQSPLKEPSNNVD